MRRFLLAIRVFFRILLDRQLAVQIDQLLVGRGSVEAGRGGGPKSASGETVPTAPAARPARSDAITLLATLQREARLVDFVQESLDGYSDAQIGAAVRDVHRGCGEVFERMFALRPVRPEQENEIVEVPAHFDPGVVQLTGHLSGSPPYRGKLIHPGWRATACHVAAWSGSDTAAQIVAPAEVSVTV